MKIQTMTKIARNRRVSNNRIIKGPADISYLVEMADNAAQELRPYLIKKRDFAKQYPSKRWIADELEAWITYLKAQQEVIAQFTETYNRLSEDFQVMKSQLKAAEKRADHNWLMASKGAVALAKINRDMIAHTSELQSQISELENQ
ncbi:hypothetical protein [Phaeodactylibacter sp.]|uniref:hypothetical protein n=1 Tax=Phaeodactylibacter sp. TaxID=1940289 RepID=UPI0025CEBD48|nr:hypothetical protein [Phaeodactylibacter sp.]MCI4650604.1 hypothetical protein [Phaeodactylibacter sp.]MCI5091369.1 hypothetical protein [Phaeodactylibacter sp.]